ncbi:hypothetical protein FAES_2784 [Fibrella aestuarina BUZ 2]|uniref:Uncharacterized protein n=1 Tax=Fibrella aestuarina BUZ 2 TaxID=1166018 RepID=I0K9J0_9BACT|nr:hypothetical protein [Fibrella aestuarina]CCH00793.1 hypothetical protein FAES_2784 [Fibrella aestuarina BUZ 2]
MRLLTNSDTHFAYSPQPSAMFASAPVRPLHEQRPDDKPPRRPDWLLIMVGVLFMITLLVAGLVFIPL